MEAFVDNGLFAAPTVKRAVVVLFLQLHVGILNVVSALPLRNSLLWLDIMEAMFGMQL